MTQAFSLYTELTVRQNLLLHARLFDIPEPSATERVNELLARFDSSPRPTLWPRVCPSASGNGSRWQSR